MNLVVEFGQYFPLLFLRCLGALSLFPLGGTYFSYARTIALAFFLTLLLLPAVTMSSNLLSLGWSGNFAIGFLFGLPAFLMVEMARSLGELFDTQRGANFAVIYDPLNQNSSSVIGLGASTYLTMILIYSDLLEHVLSILNKSITTMNVANAMNMEVALLVVRYSASVFSSMISTFLICASIMLIADLAIGVICKALPQASILCESFQLKTLLGVLLLIVYLDAGSIKELLHKARPNLEHFIVEGRLGGGENLRAE